MTFNQTMTILTSIRNGLSGRQRYAPSPMSVNHTGSHQIRNAAPSESLLLQHFDPPILIGPTINSIAGHYLDILNADIILFCTSLYWSEIFTEVIEAASRSSHSLT